MTAEQEIYQGIRLLAEVFQAKQKARGSRCSAEVAMRGISLGLRIARLHPRLVDSLGPVLTRLPIDDEIDAAFMPVLEPIGTPSEAREPSEGVAL